MFVRRSARAGPNLLRVLTDRPTDPKTDRPTNHTNYYKGRTSTLKPSTKAQSKYTTGRGISPPRPTPAAEVPGHAKCSFTMRMKAGLHTVEPPSRTAAEPAFCYRRYAERPNEVHFVSSNRAPRSPLRVRHPPFPMIKHRKMGPSPGSPGAPPENFWDPGPEPPPPGSCRVYPSNALL